MSDSKTYYDVLEVKDTASEEVIRGAYRHLSQKWHPDRNANNREEAEKAIKEINEAYAVLSNPDRRRKYDHELMAKQESSKKQSSFQPKPHHSSPSTESQRKDRGLRGRFIFAAFVLLLITAIALYAASQSGLGVGVTVAYSPACTSADNPLLVTTTNRMPIPLLSHRYSISARLPGYSGNVWSDSYSYPRDRGTNKIIDGWSSSSDCLWLPDLPDNGVWKKDDASFLLFTADLKSAEWVGSIRYSHY